MNSMTARRCVTISVCRGFERDAAHGFDNPESKEACVASKSPVGEAGCNPGGVSAVEPIAQETTSAHPLRD
jgi:hypothetical protein